MKMANIVDSDEVEEIPAPSMTCEKLFIVEGNKFCCLFCGSKYASLNRCKTHVENCSQRDDSVSTVDVGGMPRYQCTVCSRRFKNLVGLKRHAYKHVAPGGFLCQICNATFTSENARNDHNKVQHKREKEATEQMELQEGILTDDEDETQNNVFRCNDCGALFRRAKMLDSHIKSKCGTEKCFVCDLCPSKFLTGSTLYAHKQIHMGVKKHLCDYCGSSFLSKGQLKVHERSHTGEKPFKCKICNKGFSYRESLVTHASVHTGIKPYACEACDLRFSCIGNLIKHRRARPESCGLPKYKNNFKIAPRASTKTKYKRTGSGARQEFERITNSPDRDTRRTFENPPTIKKFSETIISDQKPILYRITGLRPIDAQIIDLQNADEIGSLKEENIILAVNDVLQKAEPEHQDNEEEVECDDIKPNESPEEYLQYMQSDETSGGVDDETYTVDWTYNKADEIEFVESETVTNDNTGMPNSHSSDADNYVLEIELQNSEQSDAIYTIIEKGGGECEDDGFLAHDDDKTNSNDEVLIKFENDDPLTEMKTDQNPEKYDDPCESESECLENEKIQQNEHSIKIEEFPVGTHKCLYCPKLYIQESRLKNHLLTEHGAETHYIKCEICQKKYGTHEAFIKHQEVHGNDGSLVHKCPNCTLFFATPDCIQKHQKLCSKSPEKLNQTVDSKVDNKTKKRLPLPKNFKCDKCHRTFLTRVALSDHRRSDCGKSPLYKCNVCEKCYHSAGSLKTHITVHSGDLPFSCKYCGKDFRTKGQVKVHERQHSGEKPYKCDSCPKEFAYRESLLTHQSVHTGVKRFMCFPCGSRFSCISNLQSHRKSHILTCGQHPKFTKSVDMQRAVQKQDQL